MSYKNLWKPFLIASALAFLYAAVLAKLGRDWWTDENYSHGLLVPFVIGYIVYLEFDDLKTAAKNPSAWLGFLLISVALVMLFGGTLGAELFTQRLSLALLLAGIVVYFFGAKTLKALAAPFALLLLAIPIPQIIFNKIAFPLQIYASRMAVWGIRLLEVPSVRKGNIIEILPNGATQTVALEVVEACSGIRSLMTLLTLALILAYFTRTKNRANETGSFDFLRNFDFWRGIILMSAAVPIAILTNAARVTATGVLTYYYGMRATDSAAHTVSGWLVYLIALGLLIAVNFLLKKIQRRYDGKSQREEIHSPRKIAFSVSGVSSRPGARAPILIVALIISGFFINWFNGRGEAEIQRQPLSEFSTRIGDWRQSGDAIRFDEQTEAVLRATDYTMREYAAPNGRTANLYIGYYASQNAGATYHSPQNCLPGAGWRMEKPELVEIKTPSGKQFAANKFIVENGVYNEVLIYWYAGRGRATASEYADKLNTIWDGVTRRRTDGAMIRVMTSAGGDEAAATEAAVNIAAHAADELVAFVPE